MRATRSGTANIYLKLEDEELNNLHLHGSLTI